MVDLEKLSQLDVYGSDVELLEEAIKEIKWLRGRNECIEDVNIALTLGYNKLQDTVYDQREKIREYEMELNIFQP